MVKNAKNSQRCKAITDIENLYGLECRETLDALVSEMGFNAFRDEALIRLAQLQMEHEKHLFAMSERKWR